MSDTLELRMKIKTHFVNEMRRLLHNEELKGTELVKDALTAYRWLAQERAAGRVIMSGELDGTPVYRLAQPSLEAIPTPFVASTGAAA